MIVRLTVLNLASTFRLKNADFWNSYCKKVLWPADFSKKLENKKNKIHIIWKNWTIKFIFLVQRAESWLWKPVFMMCEIFKVFMFDLSEKPDFKINNFLPFAESEIITWGVAFTLSSLLWINVVLTVFIEGGVSSHSRKIIVASLIERFRFERIQYSFKTSDFSSPQSIM